MMHSVLNCCIVPPSKKEFRQFFSGGLASAPPVLRWTRDALRELSAINVSVAQEGDLRRYQLALLTQKKPDWPTSNVMHKSPPPTMLVFFFLFALRTSSVGSLPGGYVTFVGGNVPSGAPNSRRRTGLLAHAELRGSASI